MWNPYYFTVHWKMKVGQLINITKIYRILEFNKVSKFYRACKDYWEKFELKYFWEIKYGPSSFNIWHFLDNFACYLSLGPATSWEYISRKNTCISLWSLTKNQNSSFFNIATRMYHMQIKLRSQQPFAKYEQSIFFNFIFDGYLLWFLKFVYARNGIDFVTHRQFSYI